MPVSRVPVSRGAGDPPKKVISVPKVTSPAAKVTPTPEVIITEAAGKAETIWKNLKKESDSGAYSDSSNCKQEIWGIIQFFLGVLEKILPKIPSIAKSGGEAARTQIKKELLGIIDPYFPKGKTVKEKQNIINLLWQIFVAKQKGEEGKGSVYNLFQTSNNAINFLHAFDGICNYFFQQTKKNDPWGNFKEGMRELFYGAGWLTVKPTRFILLPTLVTPAAPVIPAPVAPVVPVPTGSAALVRSVSPGAEVSKSAATPER
ncbi:MAG: hypothetical protein LBN94_01445, partial [Puniceicoccales bacterium]|nr:hypothetical protein [Puniceicoccales bacterium]